MHTLACLPRALLFLCFCPPGLRDSAAGPSCAEAASPHPSGSLATQLRSPLNRVFPDGLSVLRQFFKTVRLREACFRDVIVLYRLAVPDQPVSPTWRGWLVS